MKAYEALCDIASRTKACNGTTNSSHIHD
jgi:hypothetical protein